ncbi:hypothetical protein DFI02_110144 [Rhizobium sp. PP-F2F-G20b]|nr:hypothetical protein DFI02_110144 [Rhizobium sp. PP-F2F-G20b]
MISEPKQLTPYADRDLDYQAALQSTFNQVLHLAEQFGWTRSEAAAALQELSFAHLAIDEENRMVTISPAFTSHSKH